jgi:hypothetical protein
MDTENLYAQRQASARERRQGNVLYYLITAQVCSLCGGLFHPQLREFEIREAGKNPCTDHKHRESQIKAD